MLNLPGHGRVRNATVELRDNARRLRAEMTPAELRFWDAVRQKQIAGLRFRRQHVVGTFVLDFYCPAARLAVEIDGAIHTDSGVAEYDQYRQQIIEAFGVTVIRFSNDAVENNLPAILEQLQTVGTRLLEKNTSQT